MAEEVGTDITRFVSRLRQRAWENSAFGLLFSLVLDDRVWDILEARKRVEARSISAEEPFWSGTVWILYPSRDLSVGTNTISTRDTAIKINWSPKALSRMGPLIQGRGMSALLEAATDGRHAVAPATQKLFAGCGIFNEKGNWQVPQINLKDPADTLAQDVESLSELVATALLAQLPQAELIKVIHNAEASDRVVVYYHEVMWELLKILEQRDVLTIPKILSGEGSRDELGSLVIVIRK
jgi:hypothetical protein